MDERSNLISKLRESIDYRTAYVKSKLGVLVPSQVRALRLQSEMPRQSDLAKEAHMQQSRISTIETPGAANVTLETLARLAAAFRVGLIVKFVPFSEMLRWENSFLPASFNVTPRLEQDVEFLNPQEFNSTLSYAGVPRGEVRQFVATGDESYFVNLNAGNPGGPEIKGGSEAPPAPPIPPSAEGIGIQERMVS